MIDRDTFGFIHTLKYIVDVSCIFLLFTGKSNVTDTGLCDANRGGCEHVCAEVQKKVVCSCYKGFQIDGKRCVGKLMQFGINENQLIFLQRKFFF